MLHPIFFLLNVTRPPKPSITYNINTLVLRKNMEALRIAFCLLRVPRLFVALLLFPLLMSLVLVYAQLPDRGFADGNKQKR